MRTTTHTLLLLLLLITPHLACNTHNNATSPTPQHKPLRDNNLLPIQLAHEEDLHAELARTSEGQLLVLRDYTQPDNFRAFSIQVRVLPAKPQQTTQDIAARALQDLDAGVVEQLQVLERNEQNNETSLKARYRYVGGQEHYTDPQGVERSTLNTPLDMIWRAHILRIGDLFIVASLDATPQHHARRGAGFDALLRSIAPPTLNTELP